MPLDAMKVAVAVAGGLSTVCATCEKYWGARDKGVPGDACLAVGPCGSPIAGDVFHQYVGPMTQFDRFCFVCGSTATHALRVNGLVRVIGVCSTHVEMVKGLAPEGREPPQITILSKDGEVSNEAPRRVRTILKL